METSQERLDCKMPTTEEAEQDALNGFRESFYGVIQRNTNETTETAPKAEKAEKLAKEELSRFPRAIKSLFENEGVEIVAASSVASVSAVDPEIQKFEPEASKHNNFYYHTIDGRTRIVSTVNSDLPHEGGHAVNWHATSADEANAPELPYSISDTPEFIDAYNKDVENLSEEKKIEFAYFLQAGPRGRDETFAELFAYLSLPPAEYPNDLRKYFPATTASIKQKLDNLNLLCQ